jgi:predicted nucleic acid-binding protein
MGLILDTSVFVAEERRRFDMPGFLNQFPNEQPAITAITASELLHGVARADDAARKQKRSTYVEQIPARLLILPFDLPQARSHAQLWAELSARGVMVGPHDLQIAARRWFSAGLSRHSMQRNFSA